MLTRDDVLPAILRPGFYAGERGRRSPSEWLADAIVAYLNGKGEPHVKMT